MALPAAAAVLFAILAQSAAERAGPDGYVLYRDPAQPIPARVEDLASRMTVEELITQTFNFHNPQGSSARLYSATSFGSQVVTHPAADPAALVQFRNSYQQTFYESSRLKIPLSFHQETLSQAGPSGAQFGLPIGLGATWNASLIEMIAAVKALEARAMGIDVGYSPEVNLYSDGRYGRIQEAFSEDPYLTSVLAVAEVRGLQGHGDMGPWTPLSPTSIASLSKHYLAYGSAEGGLNGAATEVSERTLREVYARPWRAMTRAGLRGLMPSHQSVLGSPMHCNAYLGQTLLRQEMNFSGISVSDCSDIGALVGFRAAHNSSEAAALGLLAGVDQDLMCFGNATWAYIHTADAIESGLVSIDYINASAKRVLAHKFSAGLFDSPYTNDSAEALAVVGAPAHYQLALEAVEQSIVLLSNTNETTLPLSGVKTLALLGYNSACFAKGKGGADHNDELQRGGFCDAQLAMLGVHNPSLGNISIPTVLEAIQESDPSIVVDSAIGAYIDRPTPAAMIQEAASKAASADATVLVVGDSLGSCGEMADRDTLDLPGDQLALLSAVIAASKGPVIVVLVNGRPATFGPGNALLEGVDALVCAWRPGMMGGKAIWNVLSGRTLPTGRLAQNWPRNVGQIGGSSNPWYKHVVGKWVEWHPRGNCQGPTCFFSYVESQATPLFPFGFGLGYGGVKFVVESLQCSAVSPGGAAWRTDADPSTPLVTCAATVKNVGSGAGSTLIQLYVQDPVVLGLTRYWLRLVGWARVSLAAGASAPTPLSVDWDALSFPSAKNMSVLSVPPGAYDFYAGESYMAAGSVSSVVAL